MAGKILIVDDVATNRIVLKVKLASAHYETLQASTGAEALRLAEEMRPDLVLLDVELPDMDGITVCQKLKAAATTRGIPVVMVTSYRDADRRMQALQAGAEEVFWKPIDELVLLARLRSLLRARETEEQLGLRDGTYRELGFAEPATGFAPAALVALVAGRTEAALAWKRALQPHLAHRILVMDRDAALAGTAGNAVPDVFVLPADLARGGDGLRLMSELRSRPETRFSQVCVVLPEGARETAAETAAVALDLGASDLIEAAAEPAEMALRIETQIRRKQQSDRLRATVADGLRLAMTDPLTGLHNRRYALPHLARIAERARATGRQFAVMLIDLDRFKSVNDRHGHAAGDAVLVEAANRMKSNLRAVDMVARIGGEEFLVVLPETTLAAAHATAERLRRVVAERPVPLPGGTDSIAVTLSVGLVLGNDGAAGSTAEIDALIDRADRALLAAKAEGRNQVTIHRPAA
ncbi:MAG: diguanylate cyclase response regulator [Alphaproteobacteria bacterium HGW-Alphaproteobacteria-6]|nr:MAG: diguanylate cyclase response regulator [Alphaproteobacteria bacterium HGW-Alphaproteobacteria-6]